MKLKRYIQESFTELVHKVTWPTWSELQNSTTVVMVASLIIALAVALMDYGFKILMAELYKLLY
jgi:preprotein translocase subunit SecE